MSSFFHRFKDHLRNFFRLKEEVPPAITGRKMEPLHPSSDLDSQTRRQLPHPATPLGINLGIDFGTKFTKVCFRDIARNASSVISFAGLTVTQPEDAMLPSRLCIDDESNVTSGLTTSEWLRHDDPRTHSKCVSVDYIKMRLAQLDFPPEEGAWRPAPMTYLKAEADIEALSAFYIACVIDRSRKWIAQRHAKLLVGRRVEWSACLGVPVEYCDSPALDRFKRVLKIAWFWLEEGVPLKMPLGEIREMATSLREKAEKERADCFVLPEIAAAVQSFIASPEATEGIYTYFDIGSATLDGVMFRYYKPEGRPSLNFYTGHVRPLGVSAISEQLVRNSGSPLSDIEKEFSSEHSGASCNAAFGPYRKQVHNLVAKIFMEGKAKDPNGLRIQEGEIVARLPLFLGGGGACLPFYRRSIKSTYGERLANALVPPYDTATIPRPSQLELSEFPLDSYNRFSIAYGLSIPAGEVPTVRLPSIIPIMPVVQKPKPGDVIDYQDTKDAMD